MVDQVTFPPELGGDGKTYSSGSDPNTGMGAGGHRKRFLPALGNIIQIGLKVIEWAQLAMAAAASAVNAPGTSATSVSALVIGTGDKTFTVQPGKQFSVAQTVVIGRTADANYQMVGIIKAHNIDTGVMTVNVTTTLGTGTFAAWTVSLAAVAGFDPNSKADKSALAAALAEISFIGGF